MNMKNNINHEEKTFGNIILDTDTDIASADSTESPIG